MKRVSIWLTAIALTTASVAMADTEGDDNAPTPTDITPGPDGEFLDDDAWSVQQAITDAVASKKAKSEEQPATDKGWKASDIATVPKFGGYIIGSYKYDGSSSTNGDGFNLRLIRLYVDGTIMRDFNYRLQLEVNGKPHVKDAYLEWAHWRSLRVKAGQFKRAFTFENPYNPWDVGTGDYSQLAKKLSGFGDRCGEESMGGRDIGVQLQGDLFKSRRDGHYQFHYQAAVYNGQGINQKDANSKKDWIGTLQYSPVKDLWIGAFGWKGTWTDNGITVRRDRYAFGLKYEGTNGWSVRSEYARSRGYKVSDYDDNGALKADKQGRNHADAWYATVGVPVWRWIKCYAKYDVYRDYATNATMHSIYSLAANLKPHKNLMLQLQYNFNNDRQKAEGKHNYHQFWTELYVRF